MNMSQEFWNEVERIKPSARWDDDCIVLPVLTGVVLVDEELGYIKVEARWVFPDMVNAAINHLQLREQMPITRIKAPVPGPEKPKAKTAWQIFPSVPGEWKP